MKVLSLTQPWATLVALGAKRIETRGWRTDYRGPLAIHAALRFPATARALCRQEPFAAALSQTMYEPVGCVPLPTGRIVAVVQLRHCLPTRAVAPDPIERAFGNYEAGRWAWLLGDTVKLATPVVARGALGLWNPTAETLRDVLAQLPALPFEVAGA